MPEEPAPDLEQLAAIHAASFTTPRPWSAAQIGDFLTLNHAFLIHRPMGFLIGTAIAGEAELVTLAVAPEARRRGLGRELVSAFAEAARERAAQTAFLEVSAENPAAIALYESQGFTCSGIRRGYYASPDGRRIDALLMSLALL